MIAIVDILAAAVFGVAVATVFEGRWGVLIAVTPLLGALHGVLFLLPMPDAQTSMTAVQAVTAQLADPWLAVAAMVASGTGSVVAAFMLHQSRLAQQQPFWLPDMDGPNPGRRVRRSPDLMSRVERLPKSHTRRLVEEGYRGD